jgi:hypothetical protein
MLRTGVRVLAEPLRAPLIPVMKRAVALNGTWRFTVRGDSLIGELRLPDSTKFRDVRAARAK